MDLKITDERVKEAAKNCPDADKVLRTLFPEAFVDKTFNTHKLIAKENNPKSTWGVAWSVYDNRPGRSSSVVLEPRNQTADRIFLNHAAYTFELVDGGISGKDLKITPRS